MTQLTTGARWLKRGNTFDPECHRMTHRLGVARELLKSYGIEPTVEHCDRCIEQRKNPLSGMHFCWDSCRVVWPEWVSNSLFNAAFAFADAYQTDHGSWQRNQAYALKESRNQAASA